MKITDFVGSISRHPLLVPNRYRVNITSPVGTPDLQFNVVAANVPARSVATMDRYIHGPTTKVPYVEIFDDLSLTFRLSADMVERSFIDQWLDKIGGQQYASAYFDEIKGMITLEVYHSNDQKMKTYRFYDVVPLSLSETSMSQDAQEFATVTVQFAYHHYESE